MAPPYRIFGFRLAGGWFWPGQTLRECVDWLELDAGRLMGRSAPQTGNRSQTPPPAQTLPGAAGVQTYARDNPALICTSE